jgi:spoIIIJ-associated protein
MKEIFGIFGKKKTENKEKDNAEITEKEITANEAPAENGNENTESEEVIKGSVELLEQVMSKMGFTPNISVNNSDKYIQLKMTGEEMGRLIGKEGMTLNALQKLVETIMCKKNGRRVFIRLDIDDYRERREKTLKRIAKEAAQLAIHQNRPVELEPMPANERRIIHAELTDNDKVYTFSEGERASRHLVVGLGSKPAENTEEQTDSAEDNNKETIEA